MVCTGVGRVVAVVGGEDEEVVVPELGKEPGEGRVEFFKALGEASGVVAVAEEHVEILEVREDETGVAGQGFL